MKADGIILKQTRGERPRGTMEVGASGRREHYGRLGLEEEARKGTRRGGEDGQSRGGNVQTLITAGQIEFVVVFEVIVLRRKTTEALSQKRIIWTNADQKGPRSESSMK